MRTAFLGLFLVIGVAFVFYLSWLPKPQLGLMWFIPNWLARWTDANENVAIRTSVPFIILGAAIGIWLLKNDHSWNYWLASWLGLVSVVVIAEIGQLFLPKRSFDWWDIAWGSLGALIGMAFVILVSRLKALRIGNSSD